jgi:2-methylcitrate dehydratase PrpD
VQVFFKDGSSTEKVEVEYPLGHRRRRSEGIPLLLKKCRDNLLSRFPEAKAESVFRILSDRQMLERMPVHEFMDMVTL